MRRSFMQAALLLPLTVSLGGCYVPSQDAEYGYAQPGYSGYTGYGYGQPGYAPGGYYPGGAAYPGYGYNDGAPAYIDSGVTVPLVLLGNDWGHYDSGRRWHRAPEGFSRELHERRDGDSAFRHGGVPRFENAPQRAPEGRPPFAGGQFRGMPQTRPPEPARPAAIPAAAPAPQPAHHELHERRPNCPPGQRC